MITYNILGVEEELLKGNILAMDVAIESVGDSQTNKVYGEIYENSSFIPTLLYRVQMTESEYHSIFLFGSVKEKDIYTCDNGYDVDDPRYRILYTLEPKNFWEKVE